MKAVIVALALLVLLPATAGAHPQGTKHIIVGAGAKHGHQVDRGHEGVLVLVIARPQRLCR